MHSQTTRAFGPAEQLLDALDRVSTCTFVCAVCVRGVLTEAGLMRALRALEQRHPMLRAKVVRGRGKPRLVLGEAAPIPLRLVDGPQEAWKRLAEAALAHRDWPDAGPRAELTWLRHSANHSTLLLAMHHIVSDGTSGMIALRDLLSLVAEPKDDIEALPAPEQLAFFPSGHFGWRSWWRALALTFRSLFMPKPRRLRSVARAPMGMRRVHLDTLHLGVPRTAQLSKRARQDGVSVHGVLCAALAQAICAELGQSGHQRICHPVDLRRHLRQVASERPAIGEAVGYYVSALHTDHEVAAGASLLVLAREIMQRVREKQAQGEPLLAATHLGPLFTRIAQHVPCEPFRDLAEQRIFLGTFLLSNIGALESTVDMPARLGLGTAALELENAWFVLAGSVMHALVASASSFRGKLDIHLNSLQPFVTAASAARVLAGTERRLRQYAPVPYATLSSNEDTDPQGAVRFARQQQV
jgi:NRPS condensation-like uncharacterized protein